ncbi:MAG: hypothetical protein HOB14_19700 [Gammaproteobacteria bacterium]|nr:hypothetical protein [Gammaproteobacteria bacterium]MBT3725683.1 hypothetical protein [Gammaproteobacteria bacterium]MBT4195439.1 hypothetical protein [Gammaproteobacteria bacterium]MBT4449454.1 hypothetical protein [Gammaproteobacteria bacterium]MBT4859671.1 hypothetical protein [Gammaproteobacteria bacterium]
MAGSLSYSPEASAAVTCARTLSADVVAIDQPIMFNRIGAQNINYMVYALRRDVVDSNNVPLSEGGVATAGQVSMRPDKRPRPLVLRMAAGDCLQVNLQNLLTSTANPFNVDPLIGQPNPNIMQINDQVAGRYVSFHPLGLQLVNSIADDGSFVGKNANSLLAPGASGSYTYYAEGEGAFMAYSMAQPLGGEASGGNVGVGLFGVVNVEPVGAKFYRSQLNEEELRLATTGTSATGQPIIDYEARYPNDCGAINDVWCKEGKADLPIVNMLDVNEIVHVDINAVIAGPNADGTFPPSTYPLESIGERNPTVPNRLEAFREFTVVFHDEQAASQAYPLWFGDPVLGHTLHSVRDSFMINYGSGGIGSEIISNRLGVGPMHDCLNCAYEEFFLTAYTVGDVAMLVDIPANTGLENCDPALNNCAAVGPKATQAYFPEDPSNVHHSYTGDFVKFRNLHAGPKEQHIFHLHNHQWLFNANDDNSNYLDAQGIGPGSGYTYEINFGGSGNRNRSAGDAIFHCHFYPHFAQGMWEMWRNHDVTETGTVLSVSGGTAADPLFHTSPFALQSGLPAVGARALPDGEIIAGTPIPAIVPLPAKAMAPMPGEVIIVAKDANGDTIPESSQAKVIDRTKNPGYPFWIAGIEHTVGQRPTTPPLDMLTEQQATALKDTLDPLWANMTANQAGGFNGGLPRHTLEGYAAGGVSQDVQNRLDFTKIITTAKPMYFPEEGTDLERLVMEFNAERDHPSTSVGLDGTVSLASFGTNGNLPSPSAPYYEPCMDDNGVLFEAGQAGNFFSADGGKNILGTPVFGAKNPRTYKAANIQIDAVFNKAGYHFSQQRIITLWDDVLPTINKQRAPEPFVMRSNTYDCVKYLHTNLIPETYELDDYQVRTPTDIIGQHIHLPKWDLVANDGSGNGWNYEDGTLSPGAVRERIHAINNFNGQAAAPVLSGLEDATGQLHPLAHPYFGATDADWLGARTTIQRWFTDPVVNVEGEDRGLGIVFTHDHYGPSTHQQIGLYATILVEPANSKWVHNETGEEFGTRHDGGPTSWQAQILTDTDNDDIADAGFREFYFEFSDFQQAYQKGVYVGADANGKPLAHGIVNPDLVAGVAGAAHGGVTAETFRQSINPSYRQQANVNGPDIVRFPPVCPGGAPRPCAEAITADDVGMLVVNYRNEPIGLRVYDPAKTGPDGKPGMQADGLGGDLGYALQTRTDRAIPAFNTILGDTPYLAAMTGGVQPGDPFTPMIRTYPNDLVKIKIQSGATEHEHNATIHGVKWLQGGSGHGEAPNSGWRNAQNDGISEQFTFSSPVSSDLKSAGDTADYAYSVDASQDGWWSGMWGIMRSYESLQPDLATLPNNTDPRPDRVINRTQFDGVCPINAPVREYKIVAMTANELLANDLGATLVPVGPESTQHVGGTVDPAGGTLVYNNRATQIRQIQIPIDGQPGQFLTLGGQSGPLHDPTALIYVLADDLEPAGAACTVTELGCNVRLKAQAPVEPVVIRANAGDCMKVTLHNRLPVVAPDLYGYITLLQMVTRDFDSPQGITTFNNNLIRPSTEVGLHPQLVEYDVTRDDSVNVGINKKQTVSRGEKKTYTWYAGHLDYAKAVLPRCTRALRRAGVLCHGGRTAPREMVEIAATPVEFGGFNLSPADKIKQGQKGLIGAGVIEPEGATWSNDLASLDRVMDHQIVAGTAGQRATRMMATVTDGADNFRDIAVIHQKGTNQRFADGTGIPNIASEGRGIPEDSHDAGQYAIGYGSEPLWFRFGMPADAPFGNFDGGLGGITNSHETFSNVCCSNGGAATTADQNVGDPTTPVFTAAPGQDLKMRVLLPHGVGRGTTFSLDGHVWQRAPYVEGTVPSQTIGYNWLGMLLGAQESVTPYAHFEIDPVNGAGGLGAIPGDYLYSDIASFGRTSGLWGILRVEDVIAP